MMVFFWTCGDVFKTLYFKIRDAPLQFWVCGCIQVSIDIFILLQVYLYRGNTEPVRHGPHRGDWVVIIWTHDSNNKDAKIQQEEEKPRISNENIVIGNSTDDSNNIREILPIINEESCKYKNGNGDFRRSSNENGIRLMIKNEVNVNNVGTTEFTINGNNNVGKFMNDAKVHVVNADVHANNIANDNDFEINMNHLHDSLESRMIVVNNNRNCDHSAFKTFRNSNVKGDNSSSKFSFKKPSNKVSILIHRHTLWHIFYETAIFYRILCMPNLI